MKRSKTQSNMAGQWQFGFTPKLRFNFDRPFLLENTMKIIPLTQGKVAIVDDVDFAKLSKHKWYALKMKNNWYAVRTEGKKMILMHREILGLKFGDGIQSDHRNGNGLDEQRRNLRICTIAENVHNQKPKTGYTSKYKGVYWYKIGKKWRAQITFKYKKIYIGQFDNEIEAAMAYNLVAKKHFKEFAWLNKA